MKFCSDKVCHLGKMIIENDAIVTIVYLNMWR